MSSKESPKSTTSSHRMQNDFGGDLWVRSDSTTHRAPVHGRGMFAGLQDVKHYNVDRGWAKRNETPQTGLFSFLYSRIFGGAYRPPTL